MIAITLSPGSFLNLNLLQVFLLVADHRSFKEAARRTGRSQSAISAQIRQLEAQLSVRLLHRTTRSVALTPSGEILSRAARQSFRILHQGLDVLREEASGAARRLSIVCTSSVASSFLPTIMKRFKSRHPNMVIELAEMKSALMIDPILSGRYSFGIGPVLASDAGLSFDVLADDPLVALVPRKFAIAEKARLRLEDLGGLELLLPMKGSVSRSLLEQAAIEAEVDLNVHYEGMHLHTLIAMARAELGIALLPWTAICKTEEADFAVVPIDSPQTRRSIAIISNPNALLSEQAASLVSLIKREARGWHLSGML